MLHVSVFKKFLRFAMSMHVPVRRISEISHAPCVWTSEFHVHDSVATGQCLYVRWPVLVRRP